MNKSKIMNQELMYKSNCFCDFCTLFEWPKSRNTNVISKSITTPENYEKELSIEIDNKTMNHIFHKINEAYQQRKFITVYSNNPTSKQEFVIKIFSIFNRS